MEKELNGNDRLIINLILTNDDLKKFRELKQLMGVEKPNTEILKSCIKHTHTALLG